MSTSLPGLLIVLSLLALGLLAARRALRWRAGRPAPVAVLGGLLSVPRRYLVDVHEVVHRNPLGQAGPQDTGSRISVMHVLTAGGFVASTLLAILVHLFGIGGRPLAWLLLATLVMMGTGACLEYLRRLPGRRPSRVSKGGFQRLKYSLFAFVAFFLIATLPAAGITGPIHWTSLGGLLLLALGLWACLEMYVGMGLGPMKHALNGVLHLAFHPRPVRFAEGTISSDLKPLDLEVDLDKAQLGGEKPTDFAWNRLLGFDACVQCGRCEAACPAYAAGLPLNPKKLIQDLVAAESHQGSDAGYTGSPYPGREIGKAQGGLHLPVVGNEAMIHPDTIWACTTCRACVYECPMMIEHVDAIVDLRRFQTLEKGATPGKGAAVLEELKYSDNVNGKPLSARVDWATDLKLPVLSEVRETDVLLWLGEGGFDLRNQRTLRALIKLLREAGVEFAVLGEEERDCGDIARRLGDEATFQEQARRNIEMLNQYRFKRIVTADPHVLHTLRNEYPALGGRFQVLHHTTFLAQLMEVGKLKPGRLATEQPVTFHDPCYLGRYNGEIAAPRNVLKGIGIKVVEMEKSGMRSSCCGWGGGSTFTDIPGKRRIPDVRMEHVKETDAGTVAVACPNCAIMLEGVVQPRADVTDVAELLLKAVEAGR